MSKQKTRAELQEAFDKLALAFTELQREESLHAGEVRNLRRENELANAEIQRLKGLEKDVEDAHTFLDLLPVPPPGQVTGYNAPRNRRVTLIIRLGLLMNQNPQRYPYRTDAYE